MQLDNAGINKYHLSKDNHQAPFTRGFLFVGGWVDFDMNWLKKPASPMLRNIFLGVMTIGVMVMILIGEYWISIAFTLILLADVLSNKNRANHNYVKMDYDDEEE